MKTVAQQLRSWVSIQTILTKGRGQSNGANFYVIFEDRRLFSICFQLSYFNNSTVSVVRLFNVLPVTDT